MSTEINASSSPPWSTRTKRTVALVCLALILLLGWFLRDILPLVVVSVLVAFLLNPLVSFLANRVLRIPFLSEAGRRGWATIIAFVVVILVITTFLILVVPMLIDQIQEFTLNLPRLLRSVEFELERLLSQPLMFNNEPILIDGAEIIPLQRIADATGTPDPSQVIQLGSLNIEAASQAFFSQLSSLTGPAFSFLGGAFNTLINITFLIMMTFYLLKDGHLFINHMTALAPDEYKDDVGRVLNQLVGVWNGYIRGQLILCVFMGVLVYLVAVLLGVPNAPILGLLSGVLEFIPNLGPFIALVPAALLGLVSQSSTFPFLEGITFMIVIIVVWTGLQNIEAIFLVPRVMGDSLDLHPYVVILAVLGGAALAGPLGVILAAPTVASARVFGRYIYRKMLGLPPFSDSAKDPPKTQMPAWLSTALDRVFGKPESDDGQVNQADDASAQPTRDGV